MRDLVDLSAGLFAALQANEVIEVFPIDGRQAQARFSGAGLSRLAGGDYVSWSPSRGVRRWTRAPNTDGPDLVMAWGAPPPERAALEGAEILEDRGYLTWASDRRFRLYHLQTGEMLLETPQLEAIFNHPDFIALQARSARDGRSSALEWTAWTSDRVLGLSSTKAGGPTVLWHGDERITVCDISEDGLVAALTESGRPLILQLHQGDDAIELPAPLATGALPRTSARSQEPLFHRLRERQKLLVMLGAPAEAEQVKARIRNNLESLAPESRLGVQLRMISEIMSAGDWRGAAAQARALAQSTDHADARLALDICARVAHWALGEGRLAQADLPSDPDALKRFIEHLVLINRNFAEPKVSRACQVLTEAATRSLTDDPTMLALRLVAIEDILSWAPPSWGMRLNAWLSMRLLQTEPERETWRLRLALAAAANPANPQKSARSLGRSLAAMTRQWPARDGDPVLLARAAHAVIRAARGEPPPTDLRRRADAVIALLPRTRVDGPLITVMSALGRLSLPSDAATDREGTLAALHRAFADIIRATADESLRVSALVGLAEAACRLADSRIQAVQDTSSLSHLDDTLAMIAESLDAGSPLALELSGGLLARRAVLGPAEAAAATLRTAELAAWRSNKPALNLALILEAARALARRDRWPQAERLVGDWLAAVVQTCRMTPPVSEHQARHVTQVFDLAVRTAADLNHPGAVSRWALRAVRDTATAHAADGDLISVAVAEAVLQSGPTDTPETIEVMRHGIAGFGALGGVNSAPAMTAFVERLASTRPELLRACTGDILERLGRWAPRLADAGAKAHWAGRLREALRPHLDQITFPSDAQAAGLKFLRLQ